MTRTDDTAAARYTPATLSGDDLGSERRAAVFCAAGRQPGMQCPARPSEGQPGLGVGIMYRSAAQWSLSVFFSPRLQLVAETLGPLLSLVVLSGPDDLLIVKIYDHDHNRRVTGPGFKQLNSRRGPAPAPGDGRGPLSQPSRVVRPED
eukprot:751137-Hanusia_phi.AAC.3